MGSCCRRAGVSLQRASHQDHDNKARRPQVCSGGCRPSGHPRAASEEAWGRGVGLRLLPPGGGRALRAQGCQLAQGQGHSPASRSASSSASGLSGLAEPGGREGGEPLRCRRAAGNGAPSRHPQAQRHSSKSEPGQHSSGGVPGAGLSFLPASPYPESGRGDGARPAACRRGAIRDSVHGP